MASKPPKLNFLFQPGSGQPVYELNSYITIDSGSSLTWTIENPTQLAAFTAPDVTLKGYDRAGFIKALFASITPLSTDYAVSILSAIWDPAANSGAGQYNGDVIMDGFVVPNTLQFDAITGEFQFSLLGIARKLATTSASTVALFRRPNYSDAKWTLQQDATPQDGISPSVRVTSPGGVYNKFCDFYAGDVIQLDGNDQLTVTGVAADTTSSPPAYWALSVNQAPGKKYPAGAPVKLLTPYARNLALHDVVAALFLQAGFPNEQYYYSGALPNLSTLFVTPISMTGLPAGPVTGIAPINGLLMAGTPNGVYAATSAISGFTFYANRIGPPVDPTNNGTPGGYTGPKRTRTRANAPRYGINVTMKFYAYDSFQYGGTPNRYILTVTCNEDVVDTGAAFAGFVFTTKLEWETYHIPSDTWISTTTLWAGVSSTTLSDLSAAYDAIGIEVDPLTGTIYFTDLDVTTAGSQINMNTSSYQPTGGTPATGTLTRNRATGVNGPTVFLSPGRVAIFQVDGILGNVPTVQVYDVTTAGAMVLASIQSISPYIIGRSIKKNFGDGRYYALVSDPVTGISLTSWPSSSLVADSVADSLLFPGPPPAPAQAPNLLRTPYEVDLMCLPTVSGPGSGVYPMMALIGGTPWYVASQASGNIPYVDPTGLSCGDMLSQLTALNAGVFNTSQNGNYWSFRSRNVPQSSNTIAVDDQIENAGLVKLVTQNVSTQWVGYVRVQNENDDTVYGEAGDPAYSSSQAGGGGGSTESSTSLEIQSRFVSNPNFAKALATSLYNYIGVQKRIVSVDLIRDGKHAYEVGRTFRAVVDGLNRTFQITQVQVPLFDVRVKVTGLEV